AGRATVRGCRVVAEHPGSGRVGATSFRVAALPKARPYRPISSVTGEVENIEGRTYRSERDHRFTVVGSLRAPLRRPFQAGNNDSDRVAADTRLIMEDLVAPDGHLHM